jgi:hypothetical protein
LEDAVAVSREAVRGAQALAVYFRRNAAERDIALPAGVPTWNETGYVIDSPVQVLRFTSNHFPEQRIEIATSDLENYGMGRTIPLDGYVGNLITQYFVNPRNNP